MRPISRLIPPPASLSGCVFAAILRDTRGVALTDAQRFNHFPASPLVSVSYVAHGRLHLVPNGADLAQAQQAAALPNLSIIAPQAQPVTSWSPDSLCVITIGFYPDAWARLSAERDMPELLTRAFEATSTEDAVAQIWEALGPVWQAARATGGMADWAGSQSLADWSRSVVTRAAMAGPGRSIRALERRVRRWTQQSRGKLRFFSDFEDLHRLVLEKEVTSLADLAADAGFADQSHMGRAVRRATGFSPARLNHLIETDEAFWCYRLLGERF